MSSNITFKKGNVIDALLNGEVDYLLHCCNAQGKYASGVAGEIRRRIPEAYEAYMNQYDWYKAYGNNSIPLGVLTIKFGVINLVGQKYYGNDGKRYVNYGALSEGFSRVGKEYYCNNLEDKVIGIPDMIGCGLAGGDREIVLELIEHCLAPYCKEVVIYQL